MENEKDTEATKSYDRAIRKRIFWHLFTATIQGALIGIVGFLSVWQWYQQFSDLPMFIGTHPVEPRWFLNLALISGISGAILNLGIGIFKMEHVIDDYDLRLEFDHRFALISTIDKENRELKILLGYDDASTGVLEKDDEEYIFDVDLEKMTIGPKEYVAKLEKEPRTIRFPDNDELNETSGEIKDGEPAEDADPFIGAPPEFDTDPGSTPLPLPPPPSPPDGKPTES